MDRTAPGKASWLSTVSHPVAHTSGGGNDLIYLLAAIPLVVAVVVAVVVWRSARHERSRRELAASLADPDPLARRRVLDTVTDDVLARNASLLLSLVSSEQDPDVLDAIAAAVARSRWEPTQDRDLVELRRWVAGGHARTTASSLDRLLRDEAVSPSLASTAAPPPAPVPPAEALAEPVPHAASEPPAASVPQAESAAPAASAPPVAEETSAPSTGAAEPAPAAAAASPAGVDEPADVPVHEPVDASVGEPAPEPAHEPVDEPVTTEPVRADAVPTPAAAVLAPVVPVNAHSSGPAADQPAPSQEYEDLVSTVQSLIGGVDRVELRHITTGAVLRAWSRAEDRTQGTPDDETAGVEGAA